MKYLLSVFILLTNLSLIGSTPTLDSAKTAYDNGNYAKSIEFYENILSSEVTSSALHHNLGNAYYKTGDVGKAIFNYEKALLLDPSNEDALFNLKLAEKQKIDQFDAVPKVSWKSLLVKLNLLIPNALLSIISIMLLFLGALLFFQSKKQQLQNRRNQSFLIVAIALLFSFISIQQKQAIESTKNGIIVSDEANIFNEPNENGTLLFNLHAGTKLEVLKQDQDWVNVRTPNNEKGWVLKKNLSIIEF